MVRLERPDGAAEVVRAVGVDTLTGALLVADEPGGSSGGEHPVIVGEIRHLRLDDSVQAAGRLAPGDDLGV